MRKSRIPKPQATKSKVTQNQPQNPKNNTESQVGLRQARQNSSELITSTNRSGNLLKPNPISSCSKKVCYNGIPTQTPKASKKSPSKLTRLRSNSCNWWMRLLKSKCQRFAQKNRYTNNAGIPYPPNQATTIPAKENWRNLQPTTENWLERRRGDQPGKCTHPKHHSSVQKFSNPCGYKTFKHPYPKSYVKCQIPTSETSILTRKKSRIFALQEKAINATYKPKQANKISATENWSKLKQVDQPSALTHNIVSMSEISSIHAATKFPNTQTLISTCNL